MHQWLLNQFSQNPATSPRHWSGLLLLSSACKTHSTMLSDVLSLNEPLGNCMVLVTHITVRPSGRLTISCFICTTLPEPPPIPGNPREGKSNGLAEAAPPELCTARAPNQTSPTPSTRTFTVWSLWSTFRMRPCLPSALLLR